MANKVENVDGVTEAINSGAVVKRSQRNGHRLPAVNTMPSDMLRSHLRRVPEAAAAVNRPVVAPAADPASSFTAVGRTSVGSGAITAMAANAFDGRLFVANYADDAVAVLDGYTLQVVAAITEVSEPYALAVAQGRAFVSSISGTHDAVTVTDTDHIVDSHPLADTVQDVVVDREGRTVYVARTGRAGVDIAVIDTASGRVRTIDVPSRAAEVATTLSLSGDGRRLFMATTDQLGGRLIVVDAAELRVVDTLTVVEPIRGLAASHDGQTVWVATDDVKAGGLVDAVDVRSHRLLGTVAIGSGVRQLMLSAVGDRVYAVTEETVVVVCANTYAVVDGIDTGAAPSCVAESADGTKLYIADFDGRVALYSVASTTPSLMERIATPEALAGPALLEMERV